MMLDRRERESIRHEGLRQRSVHFWKPPSCLVIIHVTQHDWTSLCERVRMCDVYAYACVCAVFILGMLPFEA